MDNLFDVLKDISLILSDENKIGEYRSLPFWSWNDKLSSDKLIEQIKWMKRQGFGGYFMHARGGLTTEYLSDEWFKAISDCIDAGEKLGMQSWAYDENGWPSGFVGGKLLEDINNRDEMLKTAIGEFDCSAYVSYRIDEDELVRVNRGDKNFQYLNVYRIKSNSTVDLTNPEVVDKFLTLTHAQYKEKLKDKFNNLKGFFTDEPQYYRWAHPYTKTLPQAFKEKYNEDVLDNLGLMFIDKKGYRSFRYKYWSTMQELLLKNFAKKIYDWCDRNKIELTGHYVEENSLCKQIMCCGGIMPFYEYEHIPGIDNLGKEVPNAATVKQVASVANQLGKKKVLTETFGCCGWGVTPKELKIIAEGQYVNGVNLTCIHLIPYSEAGQRKRDYPAHFSAVNPWVKNNFKSFNDYFAKLSYLLAESREIVNVAVFCPLKSVYFDYKRDDILSVNKIDKSYIDLTDKLSQLNINYHIIDETLLNKYGKSENGKLILGKCRYEYIVFPEIITMDKSSKILLEKYFHQGGKLLFTGSIPTYVEGEECKYNLNTNVSLEQIINAQYYSIDKRDTAIRSCLREIDGKIFVYITNIDFENDYTVTIDGKFDSFIKLDIESLETERVNKKIALKVGESAVLFISKEPFNEQIKSKNILSLDGKFNVVQSTENFLLLDKLQYSFDGINYSTSLGYMRVFKELLNRRYSGKVYLKYVFDIKQIPKKIKFITEDTRIISLTVNGKSLAFVRKSDIDDSFLYYDVSDVVKVGKNEAVLLIDFYESNHVYDVLFGDNIDESLKNCLVYDTTVEACFLKGDFGVYSKNDFKKGINKNVYIGDNFYVKEKSTEIENTIVDGYPFFAGEMILEKNFHLNETEAILNLDGNYCLAYNLEINGNKVEKSYFSNQVDISNYTVKGENTLRVTIVVSNRNLLGPHHMKEFEDPPFVGPLSYDLENDNERNDYSFVRFGLN